MVVTSEIVFVSVALIGLVVLLLRSSCGIKEVFSVYRVICLLEVSESLYKIIYFVLCVCINDLSLWICSGQELNFLDKLWYSPICWFNCAFTLINRGLGMVIEVSLCYAKDGLMADIQSFGKISILSDLMEVLYGILVLMFPELCHSKIFTRRLVVVCSLIRHLPRLMYSFY